MTMQKLAAILALIISLLTLKVYALGLGHIQVSSKLNEPLQAKIDVLSIPKGATSAIKVNLASPSAFRRAGIERPYVLTSIQFAVVPNTNTSATIQLTTYEPIKEPFINFLIEVSWPSGRILREYTVLLDPPLYKKKVPTITPTSYSSKTARSSVNKTSTRASRKTRKTTRKTTKRRRKTVPRDGGSYKVAKNDTLWQIAIDTRPQGTSVSEHMNNIFTANPNAFIRDNRNLIKAGAVLRIPDWQGSSVRAIPRQPERPTEPQPRPTPAPPQESNVSRPQSTQTKSEPPQPRLRITAPETSDKSTGSVTESQAEGSNSAELERLRKQLNQVREKNYSIESENKDLKAELSKTNDLVVTMKKQLDELNKLLKLQNQQLAKLQTRLDEQAKKNQKLNQKITEIQTQKSQETPSQVATAKPQPQPSSEKPLQLAQVEPKQTTETPKLVKEEQVEEQAQQKAAAAEKPTQQPSTPTTDEETVTKETGEPSDTTDTDQMVAKQATQDQSTEDTETTDSSKTVANVTPTDPSNIVPAVDSETPISPEEDAGLLASANDMVEKVPGGWMTVGGVGGGLLFLFLVAGFLRQRGDKTTEPAEWKQGTTVTDDQLAEELARLEEEAKISTEHQAGEEDIDSLLQQVYQDKDKQKNDFDQVDPLYDKELNEELEVYMAYDRYDQAEELLQPAIEQYPHHHEYRLKLLEVYAAEKNLDKFEEQAQILHQQVGGQGPLWEQTRALWQEISPDRELSLQSPAEKDGGSSDLAMAAGIAGAAGLGAGALAAAAFSEDESEDKTETLFEEGEESEITDLSLEDDLLNAETSTEDEEQGLSLLNDDLSLDLDGETTAETEESLDFNENEAEGDLGLGEALDELEITEEDETAQIETGEELDLGDDDASLDMGEEITDTGDDLSLDLGDDDLSLDAEGESADGGDDLSLELGDDDLSLDTGDVTADTGDDLNLDDDLSLDTGDATADTGDDLNLDDDLSLDTGDATAETGDDLNLDDDLSLDTGDVTADTGDDLSLDDDLSLEDSSNETAIEDDLTDSLGEDNLSLDLNSELEEAGNDASQETSDDLDFTTLLDDELTSELGSIDDDNLLSTDTELDANMDSNDDLDDLLSQLGQGDELSNDALGSEDTDFETGDEFGGQLDLAQMFMDMDDYESARNILEEVTQNGNEEQKQKAQEMLAKMA
jgi:pilus assembly protein FimV